MSPYIKIENLHKYYRDHLVVKDLSLTVDEGEVIIFKGSSGVGKSTFLRCLTYLEPFQKGAVQVGGLRVHANMDERKEKKTIKRLREELGFVFQFFNLFPHLTVLQNLTLGPTVVLEETRAEAEARAMRLLERVGLAQKAHSYPGALSGGQQQRVGIARALAMKPKAVLFDEPTSSLDPKMKQEIVDVIESFSKDGLTMLIVTHEPAFIDRIATRIVEFGPQCKVVSDELRARRN